MNSIYAITTHHERPAEAADAWHECGVCAVGFESDDKEDARVFHHQIKQGDLVLAYACGNRIAYVGEVQGPLRENTKNKVGRDDDEGGFGYPYQYDVKWWPSPCNFSRKDLPAWLSDQLGGRGRTVVKIETQGLAFDKVKEIIRISGRPSFLYEFKEDVVKAGIGKYLRTHIDHLENGLTIRSSEECISEEDRIDFLGEDREGRPIIIECKGRAFPGDCDQVRRYGETMAKEKPRILLVAFKFEDACVQETAKNPEVELFECDLVFKRV